MRQVFLRICMELNFPANFGSNFGLFSSFSAVFFFLVTVVTARDFVDLVTPGDAGDSVTLVTGRPIITVFRTRQPEVRR